MQVLGFQTGHHLSVRDEIRRMHEYGLVELGCKTMICCHDAYMTRHVMTFESFSGCFFGRCGCYVHEVPGESEFPEDMSDEDAMSNLDSNFTKPKSLGTKNFELDDVDEHRIQDQNYRK